MIVCHCTRVRRAEIEASIAQGATSVSQVSQDCRAGSRCGGCVAHIEQLLANLASVAA